MQKPNFSVEFMFAFQQVMAGDMLVSDLEKDHADELNQWRAWADALTQSKKSEEFKRGESAAFECARGLIQAEIDQLNEYVQVCGMNPDRRSYLHSLGVLLTKLKCEDSENEI